MGSFGFSPSINFSNLPTLEVASLNSYNAIQGQNTGNSSSVGGSISNSGSSETPVSPPVTGNPGSLFQDVVLNQLPDWLKPKQLRRNTRELKETYRDAKTAYNVDDEANAILNFANLQQGLAAGTGEAVAREAASRAFQSGGQVNSTALRASAQLPALQNRLGAEVSAQQLKTSAAQKEIDARTELAKAIAQLRQNYVNTLAGFTTDREKTLLAQEQFMTQNATQKDQFAQRLEFDKSQADNTNDLASRELAIKELAARQNSLKDTTFATNFDINPNTGKGLTLADSERQQYFEDYKKKLFQGLDPAAVDSSSLNLLNTY